MKNVFEFRDSVIDEYEQFSRSFTTIGALDIRDFVDAEYTAGRFWPEPLIQINPSYKRGSTVQELVLEGTLHPECGAIFRAGKPEGKPRDLALHKH